MTVTTTTTPFEHYLSALPLLHTWDGGATWNTGGFGREHLETLHNFLKPRLPEWPSILETGAGNSTISFLFLNPRRLVSIAPERDLFKRITEYCQTQGIQSGALEPYVDGSEWVLPQMAAQVRNSAPVFDFALIDGCHNWPLVFVDFFFANYLLKTGGFLMLDDLQLHSVKELARLVAEQPGFELVLDLGKSLVFQRTTDEARVLGEWLHLPYIARKSEEYSQSPTPFAL